MAKKKKKVQYTIYAFVPLSKLSLFLRKKEHIKISRHAWTSEG